MGEKYSIIYADPPWQFKTYSKKGQEKKSADCHYQCMSIEEIMALPVNEIAEQNSILFLWVTYPMLKEGLELIESWGFKYKTIGFQWVKQNKSGKGFFFGNISGADSHTKSQLLIQTGTAFSDIARKLFSARGDAE